MQIIKAYPPNFHELRAHFPIKGRQGIVFSYGDRIYNPSGNKLPAWIIAHEEAHGARQRLLGVRSWWDRFIIEPQFRLDEEITGHRAEYRSYRAARPNGHKDALRLIAGKLASPLYGSIITPEDAAKEIAA